MKKTKWNLLRYIPFTPSFNKYVFDKLGDNGKILFMVILFTFAVILLGFLFGITTNMMVIIIGGFILILVCFLVSMKKEEKKDIMR